jgi:aminopeptidase N
MLLAAALAATPPQDPLAPRPGPGVSRALAQQRAATIASVRYDLVLDVTALDSAAGTVTTRFRLTGRDDAVLDFRGRRLGAIRANGQDVPLDAWDRAHIRLPARVLRSGENVVELSFVADIAPSGASIIRFHDRADGSDYLYTLLVPADANQLFPCFDQPDLKARVTLTLTTPAAWTAIANGAELRADTARDAVTHRYAETEPISTYLVAFAAGPWRQASLTAGGRTLHAYVRASRAAEADLDTLLALNARALGWMESYFGRPYPFAKFAFVLAPAFPFGGMEHPGAIFYNEDRFIFRERPTTPRRLGRFSTVLHEVAHMWFGDLVTMRWFDDLWLKEGFATYTAAMALEDLDSTAGAWKTFYLGNRPAAYGVDITAGTTPLWQHLGNLDQAKSNYGAIVYNKAPSVLKQLNYLVGEDAFRRGVQVFLRTHAYANATWQDLLAAIGRAAGRRLDDFGRHWMLRPGMPEVETRLTVQDGRIARLELVQRPAQALSGTDPWPMRTQVLLWYTDGSTRLLPVELRGRATEIRDASGLPAPALVYPNGGDYGYLLALLDSASVRTLQGGALGTISDPLLRAMLWGSLWDQVRAGRLPPEDFVTVALRHVPQERDEQILPALLSRLHRAAGAYMATASRNELRPALERMLWAGASDTTRPYGLRRAFLDAFIAAAETQEGVARLAGLLTADSAAGEPVRDPTRWDVVTRLRVIGAADAERYAATQAARDTTPDGRRRAFIAGAARGDSAVKRAYFSRYFRDSTLNEEWAANSLGPFNAIEHQALTLPYLAAALDSLPYIQSHRRIFFLGSWLGAFLGGQTTLEALTIVRDHLERRPELPRDLRQKILQSADELERTVRIRARAEARCTDSH